MALHRENPVSQLEGFKGIMGLRALPALTPPRSNFLPNLNVTQFSSKSNNGAHKKKSSNFRVLAAEKEEEPKKSKQSLFSSVTEALDFSQVRSAQDAELLEDARQATRIGEKMNREQVY